MKIKTLKDPFHLFFFLVCNDKEHIRRVIIEGIDKCRHTGVEKKIFIGNGKDLFLRRAFFDSVGHIN